MYMRINIIGAGPAGNFTAFLLAKKGHNVNVYEKNSIIGSPVQCTGILSDYFSEVLDINKKFILNTIENTRIYSPDNNFVKAKIKKNYVICRKKFDNYLADMAKEEGAKYFLNHSFHTFEKKNNKIKSKFKNNGKNIFSESDILIGADGPLSQVSKSADIFNNRKFVTGTQIEIKMKNDNVVEFYPFIGCYAWVVPINKNAIRIGVVSYNNTKKLFDKFVNLKLGKKYNEKIIENQSGIIPIFNPNVIAQKKNVYLIGDSATFVKATSGGGINQSLKAAKILVDCINNKKDYQKEWQKNLYDKLFVHLIAHKVMQKFSLEEWNELINIFSEKKMKKILYTQSRDKIISMMIKVIFTKPSLLKFAKYFPKEELKNIRSPIF
ncbi:NAD(P)/FAD-dependent oxidoreductase [archaeon]|jgi:digeranylgeranylglycerophospholipid reductase|nr:NAD(P)/FAD-dependent oxidoreductase [archaeon]MBT7391219.1 NAD(P)/FAD-dependent oxidoreductase [archaeon]